MKGTIELTGMKFHSPIGCFENEKTEGNDMVVDFCCEYDIERAAASDNLEDTLDYGSIYDIVAEQMALECNLLENAAGRIAGAISAKHPEICHFTVRVSKHNPPVQGEAEWSTVTINK